MKRPRLLAAVLAATSILLVRPAGAGDPPARTSGTAAPSAVPAKGAAPGVHAFTARSSEGKVIPLAAYRGKVLLIVNTASRCGFTPQYEGLEQLYQRYRARGFEVLAFPANDFMNQEPGNDAEIRTFCTTEYGTTFPLFAKVKVTGRDMHPLYAWLTRDSAKPGNVRWNFSKFLVGPDGQVVARFDSKVDPLSSQVTDAIEALLAAR